MQDSLSTTSTLAPIPKSASKVYPNPFVDQVSIQGLPAGQWEFRLVNVPGQEVFHSRESIPLAEKAAVLPIPSSLAPGSYVLSLRHHAGHRFSVQLYHP